MADYKEFIKNGYSISVDILHKDPSLLSNKELVEHLSTLLKIVANLDAILISRNPELSNKYRDRKLRILQRKIKRFYAKQKRQSNG